MDSAVANLCAAQSQFGQPFATFGLALSKLDSPHWSAVAPIGPLRHWRLIEARDERVPAGYAHRVTSFAASAAICAARRTVRRY